MDICISIIEMIPVSFCMIQISLNILMVYDAAMAMIFIEEQMSLLILSKNFLKEAFKGDWMTNLTGKDPTWRFWVFCYLLSYCMCPCTHGYGN